MTSSQTSESQSLGLSSDDGAHVLHTKHRKPAQVAAAVGTTESHDTSLRLRFNSLTLDELSEELDRRTKETQRLQEEVENATKEALEKFCCIYSINSSSEQSCHNHNDPPGEFTILPTHHQAVTPPLVCSVDHLNQEVAHRQISSPEKETQTQDQHEREKFTLDKAITDLQTKLHKVQMEKDALSDLRVKDSRKHVDQMEKMLYMLEELQNIKRAADQKQQETKDEALVLNKKVETFEQIMKETYSSLLLSNEKQHGNGSITSPKVLPGSRQLSTAAKLNEDFNNVTEKLQERLFVQSIEHMGNEGPRGVNEQQARMEDLISSLGQEMVLLTDKLSSSKYNSVSLSTKLEMLKKLAEGQTTLHQCQVSELESILYSHKDKVCCLEQQLLQAQIQLVEAQREREQSLQQAEELQSQLSQLKRCGEQQQCELQVEVRALRGRLEEAREQLHRSGTEKNGLQSLLDQEGRKSQELLREKDKELQLRQQEAQQHLSWLQEAQSQCQNLHVEGEMLKLKLNDQDKLVAMLRLQMESSAQMHSRTIDNLHQENSLLSNQLNQHKLENQQLRVELDKSKSDLATAKHERRLLQASVAEQCQRVQEETLEKQHLTAQLEIQRLQLLTLTKEHKELQRLHSCKTEECEGVVLRLQSQLRNAHDELDQVRSTLKTLEGADGHGLQVAMDMQTEITARREQVDSLQGKIQHLEEAVEKLHQEKRYQSLESQRQLQDLTFVKEEKKQLANELQTLRSKDQQLRDRIGQLEAILHKMTESFADCQDFIQLREQEFYRLKLQHALDLKELQGQNVRTAVNVPPPHLDPLTPSAITTPPSSQHAFDTQIKSKRQQESPARELRSLVRELRGVISENHRPHTDNSAAGSCFHRRRSAPERVHRTTFSTDKADEIKAISRMTRNTCGSEPHSLTPAELNGKIINNGKSFSESCVVSSPVTAVRYTSSPKLLSVGCRSPVHTLLTSDPNS